MRKGQMQGARRARAMDGPSQIPKSEACMQDDPATQDLCNAVEDRFPATSIAVRGAERVEGPADRDRPDGHPLAAEGWPW